MTKPLFGFHVVHRRYNGKHLGYDIYLNNSPFIFVEEGLYLKKHEAYELVRQFNGF